MNLCVFLFNFMFYCFVYIYLRRKPVEFSSHALYCKHFTFRFRSRKLFNENITLSLCTFMCLVPSVFVDKMQIVISSLFRCRHLKIRLSYNRRHQTKLAYEFSSRNTQQTIFTFIAEPRSL